MGSGAPFNVNIQIAFDTMSELRAICYEQELKNRGRRCTYSDAITRLIQEAAVGLPLIEIPTNGDRKRKRLSATKP